MCKARRGHETDNKIQWVKQNSAIYFFSCVRKNINFPKYSQFYILLKTKRKNTTSTKNYFACQIWSNHCNAGFTARKSGRFIWYFSIKKKLHGLYTVIKCEALHELPKTISLANEGAVCWKSIVPEVVGSRYIELHRKDCQLIAKLDGNRNPISE